MLWIYRLLFVPALLFVAPIYLFRMRRRGGYRRHFAHRFGAVEGLPDKQQGVRRIWLQAVSVGEMLAIGPILEAFKHDRSVEFFLTTTTSTGFKLAKDRYQELTEGIGYFPLDWWMFSSRTWRRVDPDLVLLTEGERWPEHIEQARQRNVPVLCVNARLSDKSFRRMRGLRWALGPMVAGVTKVLASSEHDAERFRILGFPPSRIVTTGNIKLDLRLPLLNAADLSGLRAELGFARDFIVLGSSTWPGEEAALILALKALREAGLPTRLLIVPRHAERRGEIEALMRGTGFRFHLRSRGRASGALDILVADTTGELLKLTQVADLVFIGKSLPPHDQGQTPVEAAALGKAIIFGPGMSNFRAIAMQLVQNGAAQTVEDSAMLTTKVVELIRDTQKRAQMASAAQGWHRANQGAIARTLEIIRGELPPVPSPDLAPDSGAEQENNSKRSLR